MVEFSRKLSSKRKLKKMTQIQLAFFKGKTGATSSRIFDIIMFNKGDTVESKDRRFSESERTNPYKIITIKQDELLQGVKPFVPRFNDKHYLIYQGKETHPVAFFNTNKEINDWRKEMKKYGVKVGHEDNGQFFIEDFNLDSRVKGNLSGFDLEKYLPTIKLSKKMKEEIEDEGFDTENKDEVLGYFALHNML